MTRARFIAAAVLLMLPAAARAQTRADTVAPAPAADTVSPDTAPVREPTFTISLPLGVGLRVPSYDRVNGLSLPFGPEVSIASGRLIVNPLVTYRSQLGDVDPGISAVLSNRDSTVSLSLDAARGTFSNDRWIRSDLINSVTSFGVGTDSRNYFRADRGEVRLTMRGGPESATLSPYVGARFENAWSTGWRPGERRGPFSILGRNETNGIDRPNPEVARGHIASALLGATSRLTRARLSATASLAGEIAWRSPATSRFTQLTWNESATLRTVREQRLELDSHAVVPLSGVAPPQRYAYLGGSGTIATTDLLVFGGDRLYFVDTRYVIPLSGITLPLVGSPFIAPHYVIAAAGTGRLPTPTQNIGLRAGTSLIRADFLVDPRTRRTAIGVGLSFSR